MVGESQNQETSIFSR